MVNKEQCENAIGVISYIVADSEYKNAVVEYHGETFDAIEILEELIEEHFKRRKKRGKR